MSSSNSDPLNELLGQMMGWLKNEHQKTCDKYGISKKEIDDLAEGKTFDEFSDALDKLIAEKSNSTN